MSVDTPSYMYVSRTMESALFAFQTAIFWKEQIDRGLYYFPFRSHFLDRLI